MSAILSQDGTFIKKNTPRNNPVKVDNAQGLQPVVFELDAFFLPLKEGGRESGKFITVKAELILSDDRASMEVELALPYDTPEYLRYPQKKLSDFLYRGKRIEEKIKREIIASTNTALISSVGSIKDVSFLEYVVK